jgi:DNA-binding transcriptional LysR family regulator
MNTLESMRLFVKVAEAGSFTRGAIAAGATAPQASRAIAMLEGRLRTRLLNRTTRQVALTDAGERYLRQCRDILGLVEFAEAEAAGAAFEPTGILRIHAGTGFGQHYLVPRIASYCRENPNVQIDLTLGQRIPDIIEQRFDLAIVVTNTLSDSTLVAERVGSTFSILCASPEYLRRRGCPRSVQQLHDHVCLQLVVPNLPESCWIFEGEPEEIFSPSQSWALVVNVADALAEAVRAGLGIAPLPASTAIDGLRDGSLVRVLPGRRLRWYNIHALYASRRHLDAKIRTFIDFLRAEVQPMLSNDVHEINRLTKIGWLSSAAIEKGMALQQLDAMAQSIDYDTKSTR